MNGRGTYDDAIPTHDHLYCLNDYQNRHHTRPINVKRKSQKTVGTTGTKSSKNTPNAGANAMKTGPKLSVQDFVRMDPGYTPDIEHLVYPGRKRNPQQIAPTTGTNAMAATARAAATGKTRSRLAEMFALSRHLQQKSADRDIRLKNTINPNRSIDSILDQHQQQRSSKTTSSTGSRRWPNNGGGGTTATTVEDTIRQQNVIGERLSPAGEIEMSTARGPSVSVLHLRNNTDPWETNRLPARPPTTSLKSNQYYFGDNPLANSTSSTTSNSTDQFIINKYNRELSPVRWCDREVDGVYLGRSGWVQVQQRSLDENRQTYNSLLLQPPVSTRRTTIKLADYHCNSEPTQNYHEKIPTKSRPIHLSLQTSNLNMRKTPSPQPIELESFSPPPSITPIISPPPAFQDEQITKFFHKTLLRSDAIVESDLSPTTSPIKWQTMAPMSGPRLSDHQKTVRRIPQTKSLEDDVTTSRMRRKQFLQQHFGGGSSSSSSSSTIGFRSLDNGSSVNRVIMPKLSENTTDSSSIDCYEDADDEDNNSSSINVPPSTTLSTILRTNRVLRKRSPAGSDTNKPPTSPGSSSTSSSTSSSREVLNRTSQRITAVQTNRRATSNTRSKSQEETIAQKVRRSRSLQLPGKLMTSTVQTRTSPQSNKILTKHQIKPQSFEDELLNRELIREAELVKGLLYGNAKKSDATTIYFMGDPQKEKEKLLLKQHQHRCNRNNCDLWSQNVTNKKNPAIKSQFNNGMRVSQSYPTHQRSLDSARDLYKKCMVINLDNYGRRSMAPLTSRPSVGGSDVWSMTKNVRPSDCSDEPTSSHIDANASGGGAMRENILTRPGSAPTDHHSHLNFIESQQRSMSLPKSFLSANYQPSNQIAWKRRGTESLDSSPGLPRKTITEVSHTAPVTPLHEGNRRRSPVGGTGGGDGLNVSGAVVSGVRRTKATSTPQLIESTNDTEHRKWTEKSDTSSENRLNPSVSRRNVSGPNTESVLQKFRKTFSLRFQRKGSKENCSNSELGDALSEMMGERSDDENDEELAIQQPHLSTTISISNTQINEQPEQKHRFGPLIWRTSKERKKMNKAARNAKCNSGDSGIQIEMMPGYGSGNSNNNGNSGVGGDVNEGGGDCCNNGGIGAGGGGGGGAGDSSESHDTDPQADEMDDSPPLIRRRPPHQHKKKTIRPHSDLLNQILIDKFKSELKQRTQKNYQVRRTRSDLGGQRLLHWDTRTTYRRLMSNRGGGGDGNTSTPSRHHPQQPSTEYSDNKPIRLRKQHRYNNQLRRSLSQPLDINKLSPLFHIKSITTRNILRQESDDDIHLNNGGGTTTTSDDEDTAISDTGSSNTSLDQQKDLIILAEAVFDHCAIDTDELAFSAGDLIEISETSDKDWWWGTATSTKKTGWFPAHFVRLRVGQDDCSIENDQKLTKRRTSISLLTHEQIRTNVVKELVNTEKDFVRILQDLVEGYLFECRKRSDMFSDTQLNTIFINLEAILQFQTDFLKDLEASINWMTPHKSCVGAVFLKHHEGFKMYSNYCNSHPMANATLQELCVQSRYQKFFEACRLMRGLIEIPLDGYLLTPIQRICKYPLQLAELFKYTRLDHEDYEAIRGALDVMRDVARLINERKRRMESLEKLASWQLRVEGWEDEDLIEDSTQLIYQGEVVRVTTGMWTNNITLFLFDHQIIYCKKDILKRHTYVYKGRINLDTSEIIDVPDGKDAHLGVNVRHAIKIYSCIRDKWLLFCCRSTHDKLRWLQAFEDERKLVEQDKNDGLEFPLAAKQLARMAARCQKRPPRKPRGTKNYKPNYMGSNIQLSTTNNTSSTSNSLGRKVGTWFTFGANKKSRRHHHSNQHQHDIF